MIFIVVKFPVKPEYTEKWLDLTRDFTEATRAEPGNKWFEWSRSVEDPNEFVLVEAFEDVFLVRVHPPVAHRGLVPFTDTQIGEFDDRVVQRVELVRQRGQVDSLIQFLDATHYPVHVHGRVKPVVPFEQPCDDIAHANTGRQTSQRRDRLDTQKFQFPLIHLPSHCWYGVTCPYPGSVMGGANHGSTSLPLSWSSRRCCQSSIV